jgi:hypothetical protein
MRFLFFLDQPLSHCRRKPDPIPTRVPHVKRSLLVLALVEGMLPERSRPFCGTAQLVSVEN